MFKKFLIATLGFAAVVASLGAVKYAQIKQMMSVNHAPATTNVSTVEAKFEAWAPVISSVGTLSPVEGVSLSSEAEGVLIRIAVENGSSVKAGDVLFELDSSVEIAQLRATEAQLEFAEISARRAAELREKQTNSQAEFDQARSQVDQLRATVESLKATIAKKTVKAPFDGRLGIRRVNLGQLVTRGQNLVQIQNLSKLFVEFSIPQNQIAAVATGQPVRLSVDAFEGRVFDGKVTATESVVDSSTRNLSVQATIANKDEALRPGMFARVEVELPAKDALIVLPETAIAYAAYGNSVYVVETIKNAKGEEYLGVRQQFVTLGERKGDKIAIISGLKNGEQVVSAGVFKLRNGLPVVINNNVQPSNSTTPNPTNS